jgi:hypothetical protein
MSNDSLGQDARSWMDVGSFQMCLVVRFMIFTAPVRNILDSPLYCTGNAYKHTGSIANIQSNHKTVVWPIESKVLSRYRRCQCIECIGGETEGKRPLERSRCRWNDNINVDLQEVGCGGMDWIELAQDRDR